jgi:DnaK suppressor protein
MVNTSEEYMDDDRARALLAAARASAQQLLDGSVVRGDEDRAALQDQGDNADPAQALTIEGVDDAIATGLRDRLAALDRADERLKAGTYGKSIQSGEPIPDERLEADPAAELTIAEATASS